MAALWFVGDLIARTMASAFVGILQMSKSSDGVFLPSLFAAPCNTVANVAPPSKTNVARNKRRAYLLASRVTLAIYLLSVTLMRDFTSNTILIHISTCTHTSVWHSSILHKAFVHTTVPLEKHQKRVFVSLFSCPTILFPALKSASFNILATERNAPGEAAACVMTTLIDRMLGAI